MKVCAGCFQPPLPHPTSPLWVPSHQEGGSGRPGAPRHCCSARRFAQDLGKLPQLSPELSPGQCLQKGRILAMLWLRVVLGQVTGCGAWQGLWGSSEELFPGVPWRSLSCAQAGADTCLTRGCVLVAEVSQLFPITPLYSHQSDCIYWCGSSDCHTQPMSASPSKSSVCIGSLLADKDLGWVCAQGWTTVVVFLFVCF